MSDMSDMRERPGIDHAIASWLESEAVGRAPDRLFETVFAATRTRRQAAAWQGSLDALRGGLLGRAAGRVVLVGVALAIAAGLLLAGAAVLNHPQPTLRPARSVSATVLATTCAHPSAVVVVSGSAWVTCQDQVRRFDAVTGRVNAAVVASLIAVDATGAWAATGTEVESLDTSGIPIDRLPVKGASALALDATSLWVAEAANRSVVRVDRATYAIAPPIDVGGAASAIVSSGGVAWVALGFDRQVVRIDAATNSVTGRFDEPAADAIQIAGGRVWLLDAGASVVYAIDPSSGAVTARAGLPPLTQRPGDSVAVPWTGLTADGNSLLVVRGSEVVRVDGATGAIVDVLRITSATPASLGGIAAGPTGLLAIDSAGQRLLAVAP